MNEKVIWDYFYDKLRNPYAVAALMGNLYVESKLNPQDLQGSYERSFKMTDEEYTQAVDDGTYQSFVRDGAGYGLVQWTYWSRKEGLLNFAKQRGTSIGDLNMQLDYIWYEIQLYKPVIAAMREAKSIREVSDVICAKYEKPANQTEKGKQTRADYGLKYFELYANSEPANKTKRVIITTDRTNIRAGNSKSYTRVAQVDKNAAYEWIATAENGWHAIKFPGKVAWVSGEFSRVE